MISLMARKRQARITPTEIRAIRLRCKLTQVEAAALVDASQGQWSQWEDGTTIPNRQAAKLIRMLPKLCK